VLVTHEPDIVAAPQRGELHRWAIAFDGPTDGFFHPEIAAAGPP
jgi:hypothetical protein